MLMKHVRLKKIFQRGIYTTRKVVERGPNESRDKDSPSTKCQRPSSSWDGKIFLKANEPQVDQWHEAAERKGAIHKLLHTNFMIFLPLPRPCHRWSHFWDPPT